MNQDDISALRIDPKAKQDTRPRWNKWLLLLSVGLLIVAVVVVAVTLPGKSAAENPAVAVTPQSPPTSNVLLTAGGYVEAVETIDLGFPMGGRVAEVLVKAGDVVQVGDVLVRLDDAVARQAVAEAELQVAQAEVNLALARIEVEAGLARVNLEAAQAAYDRTVALSERTGDQLTAARVDLKRAQDELADAQEGYNTAWDPARDWELSVEGKKDALEREREATERALERARYNLEVAQANYNLAVADISDEAVQNAWARVLNARVILENEPLQLEQLELALSQAQFRLDSTRRALEETVLIAPISGTVLTCDCAAGELVSPGPPAVSIADLSQPIVEVGVAETKIADITLGQPARITLNSAPDTVYVGRVVFAAPQTDRQTATILVRVTFDAAGGQLRPGSSTRVDFLSGEE